MKCLSLWQPWATLIVVGAKRIETRHWETSYRGPLLIHAAKKWDRELSMLTFSEPFASALQPTDILHGTFSQPLPLGCILGVCDLVKCWPVEALPFLDDHAGKPALTLLEREFGDFSDGRFVWFLSNVRRFTAPIPFKGHQQLFNVPDELVAEQLRSAVPT